ncbi:MAG TPA: hypothetical protein VFM64_00470 [Candidatus Nitrosotenuis sp.]|nr:hypothetical protein [Candidatus Nitrosotenuis sp.]
MISLRQGEIVEETFPVNCKFGKSILYLTNMGIMIENIKGAILDLGLESILSLQPLDGKKGKIIWKEDNAVCDFVFGCESILELTTKYRTVLKKQSSLKTWSDTDETRIIIENPVLKPS